MKLGDDLTITQVYRRRTRYDRSKHGNYDLRMKVWEACEIKPRQAIFLGYRTLRNGSSQWEDEVGYVFDQEDHFVAMLVCFSTRENPVYVPKQEG
jgi:hypothetical protein